MKSYEENEEEDAQRVAWCVGCDDAVELDDNGACPNCDDDERREERLHQEALPLTSARQIECPLCGEDRGRYCYSDDNGNGYNHGARVEQFESTRGVLS